MRSLLKNELQSVPQYPDLVGDRKLIRFLRARNGKVAEAVKLYSDFLKWYQKNNVAEVRNRILYDGINHPYKFPMGEKIIELAPQIVIAPAARDKKHQPITMETFGFDPNAVFENVTIEQYLLFLIYSLEYRALILEQLSEEAERELLSKFPSTSTCPDGYGVVLMTCTIRDLKGMLSLNRYVIDYTNIHIFLLLIVCRCWPDSRGC
jgi:hypothetical protein